MQPWRTSIRVQPPQQIASTSAQRWNESVAVALLDWRNFGSEHTDAVRAFQCTTPEKSQYEPGKGKHHPLPYELEVQSYIRNLRAPADNTSTVRLGFLDDQLLAVVCMSCIQEQPPEKIHPESMFHIQVVAVDVRYKRSGYGQLAIAESIRIADELNRKHLGGTGAEPAPMVALIHGRNVASQELFKKNGFIYDEPFEGGLRQWIRDEPW